MASLAEIASLYTYELFGLHGLATSNLALIIGSVVWIALMTWICYRGIELSARVQQFLLTLEVFTLALFAVVALIKVYSSHPAGSLHVSAEWFNPFNLSWGALIDGVLLGIFIYWGWDSGVAVNEESRDRHRGPGKAAVVSTVLLLVIYVAVSASAQAFHGTKFLAANSSDVLSPLGHGVLGSPLYKLLIICVLTSASASTQTTILPTARTTLSICLDFDGIPYLPNTWPDGTPDHPTPASYIGPFTGGRTCPTVQFESDVGGSSNLCDVATGDAGRWPATAARSSARRGPIRSSADAAELRELARADKHRDVDRQAPAAPPAPTRRPGPPPGPGANASRRTRGRWRALA
jgi:Amino acid permease